MLRAFEFVAILGGLTFAVLAISDRFFETQLLDKVAQHPFVASLLEVDNDENYEPVDLEDSHYQHLQIFLPQLMDPNHIETIRAKKESDEKTTFILHSTT